jgi:hypothetical protein
VWVFDEGNLNEALAAYEAAALAAYPRQAERIRIAMLAIRDFLYSEQAERLVMKRSIP